MNVSKILPALLLTFILSMSTCYASSLQDGINAYNSGNFSVAESKFKSALQGDPSNVNIRYYLAVSLAQQRKYAEARNHYQYVLANAPGSQAAYWARKGLQAINSTLNASISKATLNVEEHHSVMVVKNVSINNKVSASFIVDTGATYTIISSNIAKQLGLSLNKANTVTLITGNGPIQATKTVVNSIEVGGLTASNVDVVISDLGSNTAYPGLLGMSFLKNFKVTIDKSAGKITLERD